MGQFISDNIISEGGITGSTISATTITVTGGDLSGVSITPRVVSTTSTATITPNVDTTDIYILTALATATNFGTPTGTPTQGQKLIIRIIDDGTARGITYSADWRAFGINLPTTTTISKTLYFGCIYNNEDSVWDVVSVSEEF